MPQIHPLVLFGILMVLCGGVSATQRVVVTFFTAGQVISKSPRDDFTLVKRYGRRIVLGLGREFEPSSDVQLITELIGVDLVENVEADEFVDVSQKISRVEAQGVVSNQPEPVLLWNLVDSEPYSIHVEGVWKTTNSTPDVVVAVLDSGIAEVAKGLFLNLLGGYDFISDPKISLDGDGRDTDSTDPGDPESGCSVSSWHGTEMASLLAARHDNDLGIKGVASNCSILPIRILGQCSRGYANDVTDGIVWAAGGKINGLDINPTPAQIISMSFAGTGPCPTYLQSAITQASMLGAKLFAAAGNQGLPSINNTFPANCVHVTSVGASTREGVVATYSNRGFDLAAPGGDDNNPIVTASVDISTITPQLVKTSVIGTSIAVPHMAGLFALGRGVSPGLFFDPELNATMQHMPFINQSDTVYAQGDWYCPPGYRRVIPGDYCEQCGVGTYLPGWNGEVYDQICFLCPPATYQDAFGSASCKSCGFGTFSSTSGNQYCTTCTSGSAVVGSSLCSVLCIDGQLAIASGYQGLSYMYIACSPGYRCISCQSVACSPGSYSGTSAGSCALCDAGMSSGTAAVGCINCLAGQSSSRGDICTSCPVGSFSHAGGLCEPCTPGTFSGGNAASCSDCGAGTFSGASAGGCGDCGAGTASGARAGSCTDCLAGTASGARAGSCGDCGAGTFSGAKAGSCTDCGAGTFSGAKANRCGDCGAGTFSGAKAGSCGDCLAGTFSGAKAGSCGGCGAGTFSGAKAGVCSDCLVPGTYSGGGAASCSQCWAGSYSTGIKAATCNGCGGVYDMAAWLTTATGSTKCVTCAPGQYADPRDRKCYTCAPGSYQDSIPGQWAPYRFRTNNVTTPGCCNAVYTASGGTSYGMPIFVAEEGGKCAYIWWFNYWFKGFSSYTASGYIDESTGRQYSCVISPGWGSLEGVRADVMSYLYDRVDMLSNCPSCVPGTFASASGALLCINCPPGTYSSAVGASACTNCSADVSVGKYAFCTTTTMNSSAACPPLANGVYILGSITGQVNRCPFFTCNAGYYASAVNQSMISTLCGWTGGVLNPNCTDFTASVCQPVLQCVAGVSTWLMSMQLSADAMSADFSLDTTNNRQCVACSECYPGSVQYRNCTTSQQRACGLCLDPLFQYGAQCVSAAAAVVSSGYRPYILTITATMTNNTLAFPTYNLVGSSFVGFATWPSTISARTMLPCPAPLEDRQFKAWSPSVGAVTCANPEACLGLTAACDLLASTECKGYVGGLVGWYTRADGLCSACANSSLEPGCGWGYGGQVSTCTKTANTLCVACNGTKPTNSVWGKPIAPYYFNSTPQCEWECDVGYYRSSGACAVCFVPTNGVVVAGDSRLVNPVVLNSTTSKFIGGSAQWGCRIKCNPGYYFVDSFIGDLYDPAKVQCKVCAMPTCPLGQFAQADANNCFSCQPCVVVPNSATTTAGSCAFQCNAGYYLQGQSCLQCSALTCGAGQYLQACVVTRDAYCSVCSGACPAGQRQTQPCNATADRTCVPCGVVSLANGVVGSECVLTCNTGFALNTATPRTCVACKTHDYDCSADAEFVACEIQYLGCKPCAIPAILTPWCWTGYPAGKCQTTAYPSLSCMLMPATAGSFVTAKTTTKAPTTTVIATTTSGGVKSTTMALTTTQTTQLLTTQLLTTSVRPTTSSSSGIVTSTTISPPPETTPPDVLTTAPMGSETTLPDTNPPLTTQPPLPQISVSSVSVQNVTVEAVSCEAKNIATALSDVYGCEVDILGFITMMGVMDCPNFVCPCGGARRRKGRVMLSTSDPTTVQIVYQYATPPEPVPPSAITAGLQTVMGSSVVNSVVSELGTKTSVEWSTVKDFWSVSLASAADSPMLIPIVAGTVGGVVFFAIVGVVIYCNFCRYDPSYTLVPMAIPARLATRSEKIQ